jgi:DNA adenine methylase
VRIVSAIPFSQYEWKATIGNGEFTQARVARAVHLFVRYRQSRQGWGKDFATLSRNRTRRGMNEQVSAWLSAVEGLPEAHERLRRVVVLNDDAVKVIWQQDGKQTLFYCDPPYLHSTRAVTNAYEHEMTREDHIRLLETLAKIKGRFLLSGYRSILYNSYSNRFGWNRVDIPIDNKASSKKTKEIKVECVWMNY